MPNCFDRDAVQRATAFADMKVEILAMKQELAVERETVRILQERMTEMEAQSSALQAENQRIMRAALGERLRAWVRDNDVDGNDGSSSMRLNTKPRLGASAYRPF